MASKEARAIGFDMHYFSESVENATENGLCVNECVICSDKSASFVESKICFFLKKSNCFLKVFFGGFSKDRSFRVDSCTSLDTSCRHFLKPPFEYILSCKI